MSEVEAVQVGNGGIELRHDGLRPLAELDQGALTELDTAPARKP